MPRRHRLAAALLLAALAPLAGCRRAEPIRLGVVVGLSGRHYDLGVSGRDGAVLAAEELDAGGGVDGRPIELVVRDDAQDPETARRTVQELADLGVLAIVGHMTSAMAEATLDLANRERVLMVSPTVSASKFLGLDDWLVMLYPATGRAAPVLAEAIWERGAGRRLAVVTDQSNRAFADSWRDGVARALEARGGAVVEVPFTSGSVPSFGALAEAALRERPDGVLLVANALDTAAFCQALRKRDGRLPVFGTDWGFTQDVLAHGGAAMEGAVFTLKLDLADERSPALARFRAAYQARFHRPADFAAVLSYEAVQLLAAAARGGVASREALRRSVLAQGTLHGLQADYPIDRFGDVERPQHVMVVREGRFVRLR